MPLADSMISAWLESGDLVIEPRPEAIQPTSVDLHLGATLLYYDGFDIYADKDQRGKWARSEAIRGLYVKLEPGDFVLGSVAEWLRIPNFLVGILVGKSRIARCGIQVEAAGFLDPGYEGRPTLEIKNLLKDTPVYLRVGGPICQIRYEVVEGRLDRPYGHPSLGSHYQSDSEPQPSKGE